MTRARKTSEECQAAEGRWWKGDGVAAYQGTDEHASCYHNIVATQNETKSITVTIFSFLSSALSKAQFPLRKCYCILSDH